MIDILAWSTLGLALATVFLAVAAWRSAQAARDAADSAERSLLVHGVPLIFGWQVKRTDGGRMEAVVEAVGAGVGLNVVAELRQDGVLLGATPQIAAVPAPWSEPPIDFGDPGFMVDPSKEHAVHTTYFDIAGNRYRTVRRSLPGGQGELAVFERQRPGSADWEWEPLLRQT